MCQVKHFQEKRYALWWANATDGSHVDVGCAILHMGDVGCGVGNSHISSVRGDISIVYSEARN